MTHDEILNACYAIANRNSGAPTQVTQVRLGIRLAIGEVSRKVRLPSCEVNVEQALTAGVGLNKSRYALATSDIDTNVISMVAFDTDTLRFKNRYEVRYLGPEAIDAAYPDWLDSDYTAGSVDRIAFTGNQLALHRPPNASFVSSNPNLYYRGWRKIKRPSADGAAAAGGEVEWAAEVDISYDDWHEGVLHGSLAWAFEQARQYDKARRARENFKVYLDQLAEMHPAEGFGIERIPQAPQFDGDVDRVTVLDDYSGN